MYRTAILQIFLNKTIKNVTKIKKILEIISDFKDFVRRTGLEPAPNKTRICPSNIRVYQFRHQRVSFCF